MEEVHILSPDSEVDLYCLHIVYFHLIQIDLDLFRYGWSKHKIRTANYVTPRQLFIAGLHNLGVYSEKTGSLCTEFIQVLFFF